MTFLKLIKISPAIHEGRNSLTIPGDSYEHD